MPTQRGSQRSPESFSVDEDDTKTKAKLKILWTPVASAKCMSGDDIADEKSSLFDFSTGPILSSPFAKGNLKDYIREFDREEKVFDEEYGEALGVN